MGALFLKDHTNYLVGFRTLWKATCKIGTTSFSFSGSLTLVTTFDVDFYFSIHSCLLIWRSDSFFFIGACVTSYHVSMSIRNDFAPHTFWGDDNCFLLAMSWIPPSVKHESAISKCFYQKVCSWVFTRVFFWWIGKIHLALVLISNCPKKFPLHQWYFG
jgi:hypothetical protein